MRDEDGARVLSARLRRFALRSLCAHGCVVALLALLAGCGQVRFVDPDADLKSALKIRAAQRLIVDGDPRDYFHIRVSSRRGLELISFSVSGSTGIHRLPLEDANFQHCDDVDTCISISLAPGIPADVDTIALEAPSIGHRNEASLEIEKLGGYALNAIAKQSNTKAAVLIDDPIRSFFGSGDVVREYDGQDLLSEEPILLFPRSFEATVASGACGLPARSQDGGWKLVPSNPFETEAQFSATEDPQACVSVRPVLPRGGDGVIAQTIASRALITRFTHVYSPPVEIAPLVAIILFDLEIGNEERCAAAQTLVRSAVLDGATEIASTETDGAEVLILDPVQLATADGSLCHQANDRTFDPYEVSRQVRDRVTERFGTDRRVRVAAIYSSNLDLDMPLALVNAFQIFRGELDAGTPDRTGMLLAIGAQRPSSAIAPDRTSPWIASEEPAFRESIKSLLGTVWPFRTVLHNEQTVVPLVSIAERERYQSYRICISDAQVTLLGTQPAGLTVFRVGPDGPAYQVRLGPQVLVDNTSFVLPAVTVDWEACAGLCDHAAPDGDPTIPWERSNACL